MQSRVNQVQRNKLLSRQTHQKKCVIVICNNLERGFTAVVEGSTAHDAVQNQVLADCGFDL
jgi:hypothetical protein